MRRVSELAHACLPECVRLLQATSTLLCCLGLLLTRYISLSHCDFTQVIAINTVAPRYRHRLRQRFQCIRHSSCRRPPIASVSRLPISFVRHRGFTLCPVGMRANQNQSNRRRQELYVRTRHAKTISSKSERASFGWAHLSRLRNMTRGNGSTGL